MAETRPFELAVAHLLADIRRQRASPECIRIAMSSCRRYLNEHAIADAAARNDDPNRFVTAAVVRAVQELDNEFSSGPDDPVVQAAAILKRLTAVRKI
jgi:hypothetical protein